MAQHLRIRCVVRTDRTSSHERIDSVGGVKRDGSRWKRTQDQAISCIEDGTHVFYIAGEVPLIRGDNLCGKLEVIVGLYFARTVGFISDAASSLGTRSPLE
jgi:hypothetical protein